MTVIFAGGLAKIIYLDIFLGHPQDDLLYLAPAVVLAVVLHYCFKVAHLHEIDALMSPTVGFGRIWAGLALAFLILLGGMYLLKVGEMYSRGWFLSWFALSAVGLVVVRWAFMRGMRKLLRTGRLSRHYAVLGTPEYANALRQQIEAEAPHNVVTAFHIGAPVPESYSGGGLRNTASDLTTVQQLQAAMEADTFEKIVIALPADDRDRIRAILRRLAPLAGEILLCTDLQALPVPVHGSKALGGVRVDIASPLPAAEKDRIEKRIFDFALSLSGLVLLTPLLLAVALAIKLDSRGPVFFRQRRYGRNNKVFRIFKFRTMTVAEDGDKVVQATRDDVRVTFVGRFLRSTSIDELPQLLNVLLGQMSLVGPRPHALVHEERFEEDFDLFSRRRRVLPGITGWAQVNGCRGETRTPKDVEKRMEYDLYYIDNWSIWFDLEIIVRTMVTLGRGAY